MLLLDGRDMEDLLDVRRAIEEVKSALGEQARGQVQMPARQTTDTQDGHNWLRISQAFLNGSGFMGFKAMNRAAGIGMRYLMGLYRIDTGELLSLMDANSITTRRTAATNAIATDLLAVRTDRTVGIIGSGVQARAFLDAYATMRDLELVRVFSPKPESREDFAKTMSDKLEVSVEPLNSAEEVAKQCPTVVLAMRAPGAPVYLTGWMRPGVHVTGLSSVRAEAREVDNGVWTGSDLVVVDDRVTVFQSGDGRSAAAAGVDPDALPELWELAAGKVGRAGPSDVTLFKSAGNAMQDVAVAVGAYELATSAGVGRQIADFPEVKPYA
jgi:alanine dehydrogenase